MLVLTRRIGERLRIGVGEREAVVQILDVKGRAIRLGVEAPEDMVILREEVARRFGEAPKRREESSS